MYCQGFICLKAPAVRGLAWRVALSGALGSLRPPVGSRWSGSWVYHGCHLPVVGARLVLPACLAWPALALCPGKAPWVRCGALAWSALRSTWSVPRAVASSQGLYSSMVGEHSSHLKNWQLHARRPRNRVDGEIWSLRGIAPWLNPFGVLSKPGSTSGAPSLPTIRSALVRHLVRRLLQSAGHSCRR